MTPAFVDACSAMVCVDFSRESLRVAKTKLSPKQLEKVIFVQADLSMLPVASDVFDRVGSFGVYEHIPTAETRAGAIAHMARVCMSKAAGGRFSMSAYRWGFPQSLFSEREGHHGGGIYFIRLTQAELRADMEAQFKVEGFTESLLYYHLAWGHKK
jgi:SAM-dependent methyltransferase